MSGHTTFGATALAATLAVAVLLPVHAVTAADVGDTNSESSAKGAATSAAARVSLSGIADGACLSIASGEGTNVEFRAYGREMIFAPDSRKVLCGGVLVWMNAAATGAPPDLAVSRSDADSVIMPLLNPAATRPASSNAIVVLDPGHGGKMEGAVGVTGTLEKDLALDIAMRVWSELKNAGISVKMTRTTDRDMELAARSEKACVWGASAFVSIHLNRAGNPETAGCETFVLASPGFAGTAGGEPDSERYPGNGYEPASAVLGYAIQRRLVRDSGIADRGLKRARYQVLRDVECPAALVECGFLSSPAEEKLLLDPGYRQRLAVAVAAGILDWIHGLDFASQNLKLEGRSL